MELGPSMLEAKQQQQKILHLMCLLEFKHIYQNIQCICIFSQY